MGWKWQQNDCPPYFWQLLFFSWQASACCFVFWMQNSSAWVNKQQSSLSRRASAQSLGAWCTFPCNAHWFEADERCKGTVPSWWQSSNPGTTGWNSSGGVFLLLPLSWELKNDTFEANSCLDKAKNNLQPLLITHSYIKYFTTCTADLFCVKALLRGQGDSKAHACMIVIPDRHTAVTEKLFWEYKWEKYNGLHSSTVETTQEAVKVFGRVYATTQCAHHGDLGIIRISPAWNVRW